MKSAVLGSGSWGTAMAVHLARCGDDVLLWGRAEDDPLGMDGRRENVRFLPSIPLPPSCRVTGDIARVGEADMVFGAVPAAATAQVAALAKPFLRPGAPWVSLAKGLEPATRRRMSEVLAEVLGPEHPACVLSGPSFAREVAAGQPTAVVVACADLDLARRVQARVSSATFRAYATDDVCGVEIGGALKNVFAIGAGLCSGLGLGHDAVAALITRGLREMTGLAVAMGARQETLTGLAGLGDLVLTCTGGPSRNRRLGEALARGATLEQAMAEIGEVSEGVATTERALAEARLRGVDVPIIESVHDVLFQGLSAREAVNRLMQRALRDEPSFP